MRCEQVTDSRMALTTRVAADEMRWPGTRQIVAQRETGHRRFDRFYGLGLFVASGRQCNRQQHQSSYRSPEGRGTSS